MTYLRNTFASIITLNNRLKLLSITSITYFFTEHMKK